MRANEDMMAKLSICHGHGSKMKFSVSDYIRGDTAYLSLHYLCATQTWLKVGQLFKLKPSIIGLMQQFLKILVKKNKLSPL